MRNLHHLLCAVLALLAWFTPVGVQAAAQQSHAEIHDAVEAFAREQTRTLPGQVVIKVDKIDARISRPACLSLEAFLPPGAQLLGNSMVGVRCPGKGGWSLFVPVHVKVSVDMLITSRPLAQGQELRAEDLSVQNGELTQAGIFTDPGQVVGKVLKYSVGAGQVIRQSMLRPPYAVIQGQTVQLEVEGAGYGIRSEGKALNNAAEGQVVQVRTASGKVVSGTARSGIVVIRP